MIGIEKGANYRKIVGNFGEYLVCQKLSRSGFDVCIVDHTGMDVIAYHPKTKVRLGITVKSRTRSSGKETGSVYIFREGDRQKLLDACEAFGCSPWIAVYAEYDEGADLFLTSLANYEKKYRSKEKRAVDAWTMTALQKAKYSVDREVRHIGIEFKAKNWWAVASMAEPSKLGPS
jgi:Holliday junction resolvase